MLYFNIDEITELGETLETWPGLILAQTPEWVNFE